MKYWINDAPTDDKVIIWDENKIYKINVNEHKLIEVENLLKRREIPNGTFSIYRSQIRLIEMDENKNYITVHFGSDYEYFKISNSFVKNSIFEELSKPENATRFTKELTLSEKTRTLKKSFIVLSILFFIGFLFSTIIETGNLPDGSYPAILLLIGGLGSFNVFLFYSIILIIIVLRFYFIRKTKKILHSIIYK